MGGAIADYVDYKIHLPVLQKTQTRKLRALISKNKNTVFGKEHHFDKIHDVESFKKNVPIREYEHFEPYISRILAGEKNILTAGDIILFEPTAGTTSGSKLIPYTRTLKKEFQKAVNPWLFDIYKSNRQLLGGKSYWSITPAVAGKKYTPGGIPIGFEEDSEYLGVLGKILKNVFVVPNAVARLENIENFRYATAYFLLLESDLALISVWNPTFLILLLDAIDRYIDCLAKDIHDGTLTLPRPAGGSFPAPYTIKPRPKRANQLMKIFTGEDARRFTRAWQRLKLISCWTSGFSRHYAEKLSAYFPGVAIQGKGLIATEGIMTIPFNNDGQYYPAYTSHFFEFLEQDDGRDARDARDGEGKPNPETRLLHQLETGKEYTVIITTGGGLYRYNIKDKITVVGKRGGTPLTIFSGREDVCDIVGEKLSHGHCRRVIEEAVKKYDLKIEFILLAPGLESSGCYYTIYLEIRGEPDPGKLRLFRHGVEQGLLENFHYRYGRELGQIAPLRLFLIDPGGIRVYFNRCNENGQKIGDVKAGVLDKRTGWENYFKGKYFQ